MNRTIGGILLVSGTTIGAAMLALPIATGLAGFFPSLLLFICFWIYMTFTAFLILEINLWMERNTNLITMAKKTLGVWGEGVSWVAYLFLLYTLTTAYIAGSGPIFIDFIEALFGVALPGWAGPVPLLAIFGFFVYKGTKSVDWINRLLMAGLAISYGLMMVFLMPKIEPSLLMRVEWKYIWMAIPVAATSFGFHIIIPTLTAYLHQDLSKLKKVILIGSLIPLGVYVLWEMLALGTIPIEGESGITEGYKMGVNGAKLLTQSIGKQMISMVARFFSFFAIVTSFLGVSLSLSDFLADGLKISKKAKGNIIIYGLTFLPPLFFTWYDPRAFINALEYAGAFGVVVLLGLLPALMAWSGRYYKGYKHRFQTPGGKPALSAAIAVSLFVIFIEILIKLDFLPPID